MTQPQYVPFHIALKAAVEDGATIENIDKILFYYHKPSANLLRVNGDNDKEYDLCSHLAKEWLIIPKPNKVEFECEWTVYPEDSPYPIPNVPSRYTERFIGKRTKVTIEEIE